MTVTEPITRKLTLHWQSSIQNSCLRFHENMTSGLVLKWAIPLLCYWLIPIPIV